MRFRYFAIALAGLTLAATPALAGKVQEMGTGGNTIGGPSKVSMGDAETRTIAQGLDQVGNPKICVTVQVSAKSDAVRLDFIDGGTVSVQVGSGDSGALCGDPDQVDLTCVGGGCSVIWRVDMLP
ncbi:MAG: hypothetical protein ACYTFO_09480 [Planctomycetota bacterium]|jgi:hypothetical protein